LTTVGQSAKTPLSVFCIVSVKKFPSNNWKLKLDYVQKGRKKVNRGRGNALFPHFLWEENVFRERFIACCPSVEIYALCRKLLANVFWPRLLGLSGLAGKLFTGIKSKFLAYFGTECVWHALKVDSLCFW